jgi:hypothetical protein
MKQPTCQQQLRSLVSLSNERLTIHQKAHALDALVGYMADEFHPKQKGETSKRRIVEMVETAMHWADSNVPRS